MSKHIIESITQRQKMEQTAREAAEMWPDEVGQHFIGARLRPQLEVCREHDQRMIQIEEALQICENEIRQLMV